MADSDTKLISDRMAESTTKLASIPSRLMSSLRRTPSSPMKPKWDNGLERMPSADIYFRKRNHSKWSFDNAKNKSDDKAIAESQYAYFDWTEQIKADLEKVDRKEKGITEYWTGIYNIIGFYSVFQGVIFQGVTSMAAAQLSCGFYKIPVILSVLASAATFVGIYIRFDNITGDEVSKRDDVKHRDGIQARIDYCLDNYGDVKEFDIQTVEDHFEKHPVNVKPIWDDAVKTNFQKWGVLAFLVAFSAIFAYLDFVVMCKGYR